MSSTSLVKATVDAALNPYDWGLWPLLPVRFVEVCAEVERKHPEMRGILNTLQLRVLVEEVRQERAAAIPRVTFRWSLVPPLHLGLQAWTSHQMLPEYLEAARIVRGLIGRAMARAVADPTDDAALADAALLRGMKSDIEWTVQYIAFGDDRPMVDRVRVLPMDPTMLGEWIEARQMATPVRNVDEPRSELLTVLDALSEREMEAYLLVRSEGFSWAKAAELMGVSKTRVHACLDRAQAKIDAAKKAMVSEMPYR